MSEPTAQDRAEGAINPDPRFRVECVVCRKETGWAAVFVEIESERRIVCSVCLGKIMHSALDKIMFKMFTRAGSY